MTIALNLPYRGGYRPKLKRLLKRIIPERTRGFLRYHFSRYEIIVRLKSGSRSSETSHRLRQFYCAHGPRYRPHSLGDFRIRPIDDISQRLSALEEVLIKSHGRKASGKLRAIATLERLIAERPDERTPLVLLGHWRLEDGQLEGAHDAARRALSIDSRCLKAQWVLAQTLRAKPDMPGVDPVDVEVYSKDFSGHFCPVPFVELITNPTGDVHTCCPLLLPVTIGNVYQDNWQGAWNSPSSVEVRRSIHDGDFKYCSRLHCHAMRSNTLPKRPDISDPAMRDIIDNRRTSLATPPKVANLGHDATCNLSCPQCRTELIVARGSLVQQLKKANQRFIKPMLKDLPHVMVTNSGDPFASRHYREFMMEISPENTPGLKTITLLTNGVLFSSKEWDNFSNIHHLKIEVVISVDAARADTYREIRRRGDFKRLSENLKFISGLRQSGKIAELHLRFAVQIDNFKEMPAFAAWARELDADVVVFTQLSNCGTYSAEEFASRAICDPYHPRHAELIEVLRDPHLGWERILFDNLTPLVHQARQLH